MTAMLLPQGKQQYFDTATGNPLVGGKVYTYAANTVNTPQTTWRDAAKATPNDNPIILDARGEAVIFWDGSYKIVVQDSLGNTIYTVDGVSSPEPAGVLRADLQSIASNVKGAGIPAFSSALVYLSGSVGYELMKINAHNLGALPAGTTADVNPNKTFSGHVGGTTDFRGWVDTTNATGGNAIAQVNVRNIQLEITATGTVTSSFGQQSYIRAGLGGVGAVNVTSMRVHDSHVANEGSGTVDVATCYFADAVDLLDGTGPIKQMVGFYVGDQGHATRVTQKAVGYRAGNMTAGAPFTAAFHSEMQDGTNKWSFYDEGGAPSLWTGKVGFGSATRPTDGLELFNGYAKMSGTVTKLSNGSYHEMRSANSTYTAKFSNTHATTPDGLHLQFTGGAPNNLVQTFLLCSDTGADRMRVWSNGNVVNANNSYGAISDAKLKHSIKPAGRQWDDIKALALRKYKLKVDGERAHWQLGLVAQEVRKVSPGLVQENPDFETVIDGETGEEHRHPLGTTTLSVQYSVLNLKLLGAVQECMARIESLETELRQLKGMV